MQTPSSLSFGRLEVRSSQGMVHSCGSCCSLAAEPNEVPFSSLKNFIVKVLEPGMRKAAQALAKHLAFQGVVQLSHQSAFLHCLTHLTGCC